MEFHFNPTFFVLPSNTIHTIRWNVYNLVQKGFTREECYGMSVGEFSEYIRFINEGIQKEKDEIVNQQNQQNAGNGDIKMAGNSIPGRF